MNITFQNSRDGSDLGTFEHEVVPAVGTTVHLPGQNEAEVVDVDHYFGATGPSRIIVSVRPETGTGREIMRELFG